MPGAIWEASPPPLNVVPEGVRTISAPVETLIVRVIELPLTPSIRDCRITVLVVGSAIATTLGSPAPLLEESMRLTRAWAMVVSVSVASTS